MTRVNEPGEGVDLESGDLSFEKHSLIARQRGEVIVRHWQDEVDELKRQHLNELAQKDVMLEEQKRLMRISNSKIVELEGQLAHHELAESAFGQARIIELEGQVHDAKHELSEAKYQYRHHKIAISADLAKAMKGHKLYKRLYEKNSKFLRTTIERLEGSSWENEQELKIYLEKYGAHTEGCSSLHSGGVYPCDCGWAEVTTKKGLEKQK